MRETLTREQLVGPDGASPFDVVARLLSARYSCRGFQTEAVPDETIERIVSVAQLTASWCNSQPWNVIVTSGEGTERFREAMFAYASANPAMHEPEFPFPVRYAGIYDARRKETGWALYNSCGIVRGDRAASGRQMLENYRLFGAPHVMIVTTEADLGVYGAIDCGIFVGSLLMLLQADGIASIAQAAFANYAPFVRDHFKIPEHRKILMGISFGYEDPDHPANGFRTTRAHVSDVVQWRRD